MGRAMHEPDARWEQEFEQWVHPFLAEFGHKGQRRWAPVYLRGLIAPGERKSVEPMARRQCPGDKEQLHHFVATSNWDTCAHERVLLEKADALVGGLGAHLIIDDTALVKKGTHSVGVTHQYCGQLGKGANCQALVSLTLARDEVPVAVGLRLYLPEAWARDAVRRRQCGVPEALAFRPKWKIALDEIARVVSAGVTFGDVLADAGYGSCAEFRQGLSALGLRWAVGVSADHHVYAQSTRLRVVGPNAGTGRPRVKRAATAKPRRAADVLASLGPHALQTVEWRKGTKGTLHADFAALRVRAADGEPAFGPDGAVRHRHGPGDEVWLIFERRSNGETKYHLSNYPAEASLETLVAALKARWSCEQAHQQMKEELGLDHFEGRSWTGLHHHALLTMIAFAFLQHLRKLENKAAA
jgi:SRSO17 transposase